MTQLSYSEMQKLMDYGHHIYEIWRSPIYVHTRRGKGGGDFYTDPILQAQPFSDTSRLPLSVTKQHPPFKKSGNKWQWKPGDSIEILLTVFKLAGYRVIRTEEKRDAFNRGYILYFVSNSK